MSLRSVIKRLFLPAIAVLCLVACVWAGRLEFQNSDQPISRLVRTAVALGSTQFAIADFDGDRQPDLALIRVTSDGSPSSQYSVDFNFSGGHKPTICFVGPAGGMQISPRDVNGDKFADLVVTSLLDSKFVVIFLNDGKGNFVSAEPSDYPGALKGTGFRLVVPEDTPAGLLAFQVGRSMETEMGNAAGWHESFVSSSVGIWLAPLQARSELALSSAGRAPPLV
jgi:hypothetical protein